MKSGVNSTQCGSLNRPYLADINEFTLTQFGELSFKTLREVIKLLICLNDYWQSRARTVPKTLFSLNWIFVAANFITCDKILHEFNSRIFTQIRRVISIDFHIEVDALEDRLVFNVT